MDPRQALLQQVSAQVEAFIACICEIDADALRVTPLWSAKDVLAHLTFWHESFARNLHAVAHRQKPSPLKGRLGDLNQQGVEAFRPLPVAALVERLRAAQASIASEILDPVRGLIPYRRGSRPYAPEEHLEIVRDHLRKHLTQVRSALKGTTRSSASSDTPSPARRP